MGLVFEKKKCDRPTDGLPALNTVPYHSVSVASEGVFDGVSKKRVFKRNRPSFVEGTSEVLDTSDQGFDSSVPPCVRDKDEL